MENQEVRQQLQEANVPGLRKSELGRFHKKHGGNIKLSERDTVAHRFTKAGDNAHAFQDAVIFSEKPIPLGSLFQVKILEQDLIWSGHLDIGFTLERPDNIAVLSENKSYYHESPKYWIVTYNSAYHNGKSKDLKKKFNPGVSQSVSCMVNKEGELRYFLDGVDQGVAWSGVTTDKPMWGFAHVYGKTAKVKSDYFTVPPVDIESLVQQLTLKTKESQDQQELLTSLQRENTTLREQLEEERVQLEDHRLRLQSLQEQRDQLLEKHRMELEEERRSSAEERERFEAQVKEQRVELEEQRRSATEERERFGAQVEELRRQLEEAIAHNHTPKSTAVVVPPQGDEGSWNVPREEVEVTEEIGRGGWGLILKGRFRGQPVAVKKAFREILQQPYTIRQMKREIQIMASVQHPNLVRFVAAVIDDRVERGVETPLLVVELLDMDLRHAYSTMDLGPARVSIFRDVAYALHYLHEHQEPIIHRDVSAPNVLLESLQGGSYRAKLSDFGSANKVKDSRTAAPGAICYTAPEVFPPADPDAQLPPQTPKVDVFSYGVLLAEVITKTLPTTENRRNLFRQVQGKWQLMYDLIISCTKPNPSERPTMASILNRTLNKIPTPRPQ